LQPPALDIMKPFCLLVVLLILAPSGRAETIVGHSVNRSVSSPVASWPEDCVVRVYFVEHMFTAEEKKLLWGAIETWTQRAKQKSSPVRFVLAGETGGLIDCVGCLTIARQGLATHGTRQRVSFNALRQNNEGRLISAWIGFERAPTTDIELKNLLFQALERGLTLRGAEMAKGVR
jgi:hypothetical protein